MSMHSISSPKVAAYCTQSDRGTMNPNRSSVVDDGVRGIKQLQGGVDRLTQSARSISPPSPEQVFVIVAAQIPYPRSLETPAHGSAQ
jgi:hypothetical protein